MTAGLPVGNAAWLRLPVSFFLTILLLSGVEANAAARVSVSIASPTARSSYATTSAAVSLAGTAGSSSSITRVTWRNEKNGSKGIAAGTRNWSAASIPLQPGVNKIVVTAYSSTYSSGQDTLSVTYTAPAASTTDTTAPSAPGTLTATVSSSSQINLSWGAATDSVGVTGYRVERCTGAGCTSFAQIATAGGTTYSNSGLTGGTTYRYRVRAADAAGNLGGYSAMATATTSASGDGTPPTAPPSLGATARSASQIALTWGTASDAVGVTGYRIERCAGVSCTSFAQIGTAGGTTYSDTGLTASTGYRYRVRANDAAGNLAPTRRSPPPPQRQPPTPRRPPRRRVLAQRPVPAARSC